MALSINLVGSITEDESFGLQNLEVTPSVLGDADDNDILVSSLPTDFADRLTALGASGAIGAALTGQ